ncbi:MAG: hypothetical protein ACK5MI_07960 [Mangrovibacterium sp.]
MRKKVVLNIKHMRHLLLILSVTLTAIAFDSCYDGLDTSWSKQMETLLHQDAQQNTDVNSQVFRLCAVNNGSYSKILQNQGDWGCKDITLPHANILLDTRERMRKYHASDSTIEPDNAALPLVLRFSHLVIYHQADADDSLSV